MPLTDTAIRNAKQAIKPRRCSMVAGFTWKLPQAGANGGDSSSVTVEKSDGYPSGSIPTSR